MPGIIQPFQLGTLRAMVEARTAYAIQCGAIQRISTRFERLEQGGVTFLIRIVSNLARKVQVTPDRQNVSRSSDTKSNPFLPYDQNLFMADVSETHVCLLNKFNVLDHHLLMVTRSFQEQESLLTVNDFHAVMVCLAEFEGLVFYNAGQAAGASQRHKHLQMVPLPLTQEEMPHIPMEPLLNTAMFEGGIGWVPDLPFTHVLTRMDPEWLASPWNGAHELWSLYLMMLGAVGLSSGEKDVEPISPAPYNLLVTRDWIFLVPRSTECFKGLSVNALGFAGALLVKDEKQLDLLKTCGPMTVLQQVARS